MVRHSLQHTEFRSSFRFWSLLFTGAVLLGITAQSATAQSASTLPSPVQIGQASVQARLPQSVAQQVIRDLAQQLNLPQRSLSVASFSSETWGDSCLGLAKANERCAMATVSGWRVELTNGQQSWFYRTDRTGQVIRQETADAATLPPDVQERLLQTVAQQARVPASSLKITAVEPATWDGCMGIYQPGRACTRIAISGWRVVVSGNWKSWVYHVSTQGDRMVQNATASGSGRKIAPEFMTAEQQPEPANDRVVFRMIVSGGLRGTSSEVTLLNDGTMYRRNWGANPNTATPIVMKRLPQRQVQQFQQLLQQQRFPNLRGMRYLTSAALADYPTTTVQAMGATVQYIDLEQSSLPAALQTVIRAWQQL